VRHGLPIASRIPQSTAAQTRRHASSERTQTAHPRATHVCTDTPRPDRCFRPGTSKRCRSAGTLQSRDTPTQQSFVSTGRRSHSPDAPLPRMPTTSPAHEPQPPRHCPHTPQIWPAALPTKSQQPPPACKIAAAALVCAPRAAASAPRRHCALMQPPMKSQQPPPAHRREFRQASPTAIGRRPPARTHPHNPRPTGRPNRPRARRRRSSRCKR
jgi:hypothetical protein